MTVRRDADWIDARLRLFTFAAAPERLRYLAILRAFQAARERYALQLAPEALAAELVAAGFTDLPDDLTPSLDQLGDWGLLARSQDTARARTLAEYQRRRSVYALTEIGWVAWQAVEGVLAAEAAEGELRRLALRRMLEDLRALAEANASDDDERVAMLLGSLDVSLADLARRARRFELQVADLARTTETSPEAFLMHKDRLLQHMTEFLGDLQRLRPLLAAAVGDVEATGVQRMCERAAHAEPGISSTEAERVERWRRHWGGVVHWFVGAVDEPSEAERLDARTTRAIRDLAGLLRRVAEARRGLVSRAVGLAQLARWFTCLPSDDAAHALFALSSGLRPSRHLSIAAPEAASTGASWWEGPAVAVDTTLRKQGRVGTAGPPARVRDVSRSQAIARVAAADAARESARSEAGLVGAVRAARPLSASEFGVLLRLLDRALVTRRPAAGGVLQGVGATRRTRLRVAASPNDTVIEAPHGALVLRRMTLQIDAVEAP